MDLELSNCRVAILTNMATPYRVPFFIELAKVEGVKSLDVLTCVEKEVDREWDIKNDSSYRLLKLFGITVNLNRGTDEKRIIHFRFGVIWYLIFSRPDKLIIGDASFTSYLASFFCLILNIDYYVWSEITTASPVSKGFAATLRKYMYKYSNKIVASCESAKQFINSNGPFDEKIAIVHNSVDDAFFVKKRLEYEPLRLSIREEMGIDENTFCFIFVGRLIKIKNVLETIRVVSSVSKKKKVHLIVAGSGPLESEAKQLASELGFFNIHFSGFTTAEQLTKLYTAADSLILLSEYDAWGMVINEALHMGIPFFASDTVSAAVELSKFRDYCKVLDSKDSEIIIEELLNFVSATRPNVQFSYTAKDMAMGFASCLRT
ncbi:glycosyltransferase family 4 protein [Motilimonas sp. 1_MG-2023]|uniref:glycosyltransferase family 4 protein n=1 Tax=Motilimonas sp. 1_MG-2023 TaxID=3062672 RepID=UPI0026E1CA0F|nr:glycosyltransferase family 4 protein [Motilimonas sp. 1_MG-2023]MDO6527445.1 glycosyltransferase family 4 protein [Motilimonas sp. 1_MG-2023]